ncbi:TetR/AcrR family transcriptional regulator [Streptomyces sp. NPDC054865]
MTGSTTTPRERYRRQVRDEVKEKAWQQIAGSGASALSLNAIAKQMGMSGPALYRYFAGRDELITELVTDAYRGLADTFAAVTDDGTGRERLAGLAAALRRWALEDPHRYFLIYGTPIPGYHAPDDVTAIASEMMSVLLDACATAIGADSATGAGTRDLDAHLTDHREWADSHPDAPPEALRTALAFWSRLHGALSLELAGHFTGMGLDPALLFAAEVDALTSPPTMTK